MMTHILVTSNSVSIFLLTVLNQEQSSGLIELRTSDPLSSLYGSAKTFLGIRNEPVVILLDAHSTDINVADRLRESAQEVMGDAMGSAPLRILIAVPAVESLFFERPDAVKRAFPHASDSLIEIGKISPATALSRLDPSGNSSFASLPLSRALNAEDIAAIRSLSPIRELLEFLGELQRDGVVHATVTA